MTIEICLPSVYSVGQLALSVEPETVNVLIGAVIALAGAFLVEWYRTRVQRRNLLRALFTEIKYLSPYSSLRFPASGHADDVTASLKALIENPETGVRTTVYESNLSEIGLLDTQQIEALARFHSYMNLVSMTLNDLDVRFVEGVDDEALERTFHRLERRQDQQPLPRDGEFSFRYRKTFHWEYGRREFHRLLEQLIDQSSDPEVRNTIRVCGAINYLELARGETLETLGAEERDLRYR